MNADRFKNVCDNGDEKNERFCEIDNRFRPISERAVVLEDRAVDLAAVGLASLAFHTDGEHALVDRRLAVDALCLEAAVIDADGIPGALKV